MMDVFISIAMSDYQRLASVVPKCVVDLECMVIIGCCCDVLKRTCPLRQLEQPLRWSLGWRAIGIPKKNQATSSYRVVAIYFPSFCWGRHKSTNKNKIVTLELGACSSEIYPLCKIWKTHQSIIFPGKSWAPHGFSMVFPIYVGKSRQVFSFSHGKSRHMPYPSRWDTSKPPLAPSQPSWRMAAWWPGDIPAVVGTSAASKILFETCRTAMEPWGVQRLRVRLGAARSYECYEVPKHIVGI